MVKELHAKEKKKNNNIIINIIRVMVGNDDFIEFQTKIRYERS